LDGRCFRPFLGCQILGFLHQDGGSNLLSSKNGAALLLGLAAGIVLLMLRLQIQGSLALSQPVSYHNFADQRAMLAIPNFFNITSNLPFAVIGIWGMVFLFSEHDRAFLDPRERRPYLVLFTGLFLIAFGSAYYHLAPSNATLVWDRLPMSIMFAGFMAAVIAERIDVEFGIRVLPFLLLLTIASVLQWYYSERRGHGDLRWYAAVQIYSVLLLLIAPILRSKYTRNWDFMIVFALYALAKIFETFDRRLYSLGQVLSGHTLKHLAAAAAGYWILRMLQNREPLYS
jgi:Ceramidase